MKYTVTKPVQVPAGTIVSISKEQADVRGAQLRHVKGNQHEALVPVWFKAGETINIDEPAKYLLDSMVEGTAKPDKAKAEKGGDELVAMAEKAAKVLHTDEASPIQQADLDTLPAVKASAAHNE